MNTMNNRENLRPSEVEKNKESIQLIWLDENINHSSDSRLTKRMLIELNPTCLFYTDVDHCFDLIKSIKDEQIFVIVSGALARCLLSQLHHYRSLVAVFIFCAQPEYHQELTNDYDKTIGIYTDQQELLEAIREKMHTVEKQMIAFNLFDQKQTAIKDLSKDSASFLWHQMLIYVLKGFPQDHQSKQQLLKVSREYYQNNKKQLEKIERFDNSYTYDQAIQWYTDDGFLCRLLNKALRTENIQLLYTFRFFIIDLCKAIEKESRILKNKGILKYYRGTQIPNDELQKFDQNVGEIISTNGYFSTSKNMQVSLQFASTTHLNNNYKAVLFEIDVDSTLDSISFVEIDQSGEEEVLFNLNSTFKILSVKYDKKLKVWKIKLKTTGEGSEKVEEYLHLIKQDMEDYSPMICFGRLLMNELGQIEQAEKYFEMLLKSLSQGHPKIGSVYVQLGNIYGMKGELNLALINYKKGHNIHQKRFSPNHPQIAMSFNNIGNIYARTGNYKAALEYYEQALKIFQKSYPRDNVKKAMTIVNIALVHMDESKYTIALTDLWRAHAMFKRVLPHQHPSIARCLGHVARVYEKKHDLSFALDYYQQQLSMQEQCLPCDHANFSSALYSILNIYKQMNKIDKGLSFCQKKLLDQKKRLGENHINIARTLKIIGDVMMNIYPNKSIRYYEQALVVLKNSISSDYQLTFICWRNIAILYLRGNMLEHALECFIKGLHFGRQAFSPNHIDIADILHHIGLVHEQMANRSKALRCYNESLLIYQLNYGSMHKKSEELEEAIQRLNIFEI